MKKFRLLTMPALLLLTASAPATAGSVTPSCQARTVVFEDVEDLTDRVEIVADSGEVFMKNELLVFTGNVQMRHAQQRVTADEIRYSRKLNQATASGDVGWRQAGFEVDADSASVDINARTAELQKISYRILEVGGQGKASSASVRETGVSRLYDISYSTCPPEAEAWRITAKSIDIDRENGVGKVTGARISFMGMTHPALPGFSFPLDDSRKSGFLVPKIGYSESTGFDFSIPYYFNLAPNYDATLTPRITSERGALMGGEFRYLTPVHSGKLFGEVAFHDTKYPYDEQTRYVISAQNQSKFNTHLKANINYNYLSDIYYLEDFSGNLSLRSSRYANQTARLSYDEENWSGSLLVENLQVIDADTELPYKRLPQLDFNWYKLHRYGLVSRLDAQLTQFERSDSVTGGRLHLRPAVGVDWIKPWGHMKSMLSGHFTDYNLENVSPENPATISRNLYTLSADGGLFYERQAQWFAHAGHQTLEPRLFYLYTPFEDQQDIPLFDTKLADFSFANLFRENRFAGFDRIGGANQITAALTTRFIDNSSQKEWARASFGQIYYIDERSAAAFPDQLTNTDTSQFVGELYARLTDLWSTEAVLQWDPHEELVEKSLLRLSYHDDPKKRFLSVAYRKDRSQPAEFTDLSFRMPVSTNINAVGRWQYSLLDKKSLDTIAGIEYDSCCWRLRAVAQQRITDNGFDNDLGFYLQLELKGLGGIGSGGIDSILSKNVYGHDGFEYY